MAPPYMTYKKIRTTKDNPSRNNNRADSSCPLLETQKRKQHNLISFEYDQQVRHSLVISQVEQHRTPTDSLLGLLSDATQAVSGLLPPDEQRKSNFWNWVTAASPDDYVSRDFAIYRAIVMHRSSLVSNGKRQTSFSSDEMALYFRLPACGIKFFGLPGRYDSRYLSQISIKIISLWPICKKKGMEKS